MIILSPPLGQFLTVGPEGEAYREQLLKGAAHNGCYDHNRAEGPSRI